MSCSLVSTGANDPVITSERREHARVDIPAAVVVVGQPGEHPQVLTTRILNLSQSGANIVSKSRINDDRLWLAFTAEQRLIVETELIWTDDESDDSNEFHYGVRFVRSLGEQEFLEVIKELHSQPRTTSKLNLSVRQREESLYSLFRGHSPQGARAV